MKTTLCACLGMAASVLLVGVAFAQSLPIADVHVHYSHDSVKMTPPEQVVALMRDSNLRFALVSSSDDNGTQLLYELAPELIIPALRPYRRRGELGSWFTDPAALEYVERLLATHKYASLGEFHLSGASADMPIPRRIVELADEHNLLLHAHSDSEAVERLLAQNDTVKVLWAHSGFENPEQIGEMLGKHDRLWADLAFRSEVGSGGSLSDDWRALFEAYPDRLMLGTDTYTPERMFFVPEHAEASRVWLDTLPKELAENIAYKNAERLILPIWDANRLAAKSSTDTAGSELAKICAGEYSSSTTVIDLADTKLHIKPLSELQVSEPVSLQVAVCGSVDESLQLKLDAQMPAHGHGMNYQPLHTMVERSETGLLYLVEGVVLHMPGKWQWQVELGSGSENSSVVQDFVVQ